jgi:hypothetical protein
MNALRLEGFWSITEGLAALAHDIPGPPVSGKLSQEKSQEPAQWNLIIAHP